MQAAATSAEAAGGRLARLHSNLCPPCAPAPAAAMVGHDGTAELKYSQVNPRPLPDWSAAERATHERLMRRCFELARQAVDNGNCPYAGLLATAVNPDGSGGEIVLEHCNGVYGKDGPGQYLGTPGRPDLTDHGEAGAIRAASALLPHDQLATLSLYTSTEPCAMCSTAIFWAGCPKMIYGTAGPARGALGNMDGYMDIESPFSGNYGLVCAPAAMGGRGIDSWRVLDGIPNALGETRTVIGPLLPEEGIDTHYYKKYWGVAKPGPDVETKWGVPVAALDGSFS